MSVLIKHMAMPKGCIYANDKIALALNCVNGMG